MTIENAGADLLPVQGLVTVELADADSGRVLHRETAHNFLSLQSLAVARWWQRMMWGAINPVQTNDAVGQKPTEMPWFPAQHLAYWDDATAEASSTEDRIEKDLVGWASRWPVGSPSGKRGVVNITESNFTDSLSKWVFDWTTSQGNGTFQSVGWTRLDETNGIPIPRFPEDDSITFTNTGTGSTSGSAPLWWDSATSLWNIAEWVSGSSQYRIESVAAGGGATTSICLLPAAAWSADSGNSLRGLARISTDIIACGNTATTTALLRRYTSAGVQSWTRSETGIGGAAYMDCTIDGSSNIWTAGSDGAMRRHSNADGTITASATPALGPTALTGIAYDATDSNFWLIGTVGGAARQMWKVDSSGNTVGPMYSFKEAAATTTSTAPFTGSYTTPQCGNREPYSLAISGSGSIAAIIAPSPTRTSAAYFVSTSNALTIAVKAGVPWLGCKGSSTSGTALASPVRGGTLGTRSKLGSAITKTNTQTLKITYQFNFS